MKPSSSLSSEHGVFFSPSNQAEENHSRVMTSPEPRKITGSEDAINRLIMEKPAS